MTSGRFGAVVLGSNLSAASLGLQGIMMGKVRGSQPGLQGIGCFLLPSVYRYMWVQLSSLEKEWRGKARSFFFFLVGSGEALPLLPARP